MIAAAITILAKREDLYNSILKAEIFKELERDYQTIGLDKLLTDRKNGTWGKDYIEGGIKVKVLRSQDIRHGFIDYEKAEVRYVSNVDLKKNQLMNGDILVIKSNGSEDLVGKSQIYYSNQQDTFIPSNFLMRIRANQDLVIPDYLDLFLKSPQALKWRTDKQSTTTGLRNLDTQGYLSVNVPLPSLKEQESIVANYNSFRNGDFSKKTIFDLTRIERFKNFCGANTNIAIEFDKQHAYLQNLRQTVLQEAVQGKLTTQDPTDEPAAELLRRIKAEKQKLIKAGKLKKEKELPPITEDEIPFELPEGWAWCRLGEVGILKRGKSKHRPRNDRRLFLDGIYPFIQTGEVSKAKKQGGLITSINGYYNEFGLEQSEMQKAGTLCITIAANIAEYGFLGLDACVPDSIVCFNSVEEVTSRYVSYFIDVSKGMLEKFAPSTAQKNINLGILNELKFPLPPLPEQQRIVAKVKQLQRQLSQLEEQVQQSREYAQHLLQSLLREAFEEKGKVYEMAEEKVTMVAEE